MDIEVGRGEFTHWRVTEPAPAFLVAPSRISKRSREWGADVLAATMAEVWAGYAAWVTGWMSLDRVAGPDAVIEVFRTHLSGRVDPRVGTICMLQTQEVPA